MRNRLLATLLLLAACVPSPEPTVRDIQESSFQVGQEWSYRTRSRESRSTLIVLMVEAHPVLGTVVHISLDGLRIRSSSHPKGYVSHVRHLPISEAALERSVLQLLREGVPLPDFQDGYDHWSEASDGGRAGIFTTPVAEGVEYLERSLNM